MIMNREPIGTNLRRFSDKYIFENPPKYWNELLSKMTSDAKIGCGQIIVTDRDVLNDVCYNVNQYETLCKIENIKFDFHDMREHINFGW